MTRWLALAVAAVSTLLFLEGVSLGAELGLAFAETKRWPPLGVDWSALAEIAVWVALLMAPAVLFLRRRRHELWRVTAALACGVALVSFVRLRLASNGRFESILWAVLDGAAFALGLLFFDFVHGLLTGPERPDPAAKAEIR